MSAPAGAFLLDAQDGRALVLLSGGVGSRRSCRCWTRWWLGAASGGVWYVHAALSGRHHAMKQHLKEVVAAHPGVRSVVFY